MKITDLVNLNLIGISYFKDDTLQEIYKTSGELAENNEFQVHYWALNAIKKYSDNSRLVISYPVVIYNYKQEVTSTSIDFDLTDVEDMSDKLKPIAEVKAKELKEKLSKVLDKDFIYELTPLNSLHRHP